MTRRDYNLIAAAIRKGMTQAQERSFTEVMGATKVLANIADTLAEDNPRFDRDRFIRASTPGLAPTPHTHKSYRSR